MRGSLDFWERKVVIMGKELKLVTVPNNIVEKLDWLDEIVAAANERVEKYNKNMKKKREVEKTARRDEEAIRTQLSMWLRRIPA